MTAIGNVDSETLRCGGACATLLRVFQRPTNRALRVAVSGGIGSGKSTLARALLGPADVLADADAIARELLNSDTTVREQIREHFGSQVFHEDGSVDRAALGRVVFADPRQRAVLETLTHPRIFDRSTALLDTAHAGALAVHDIPLLLETGMTTAYDVIIMLDAPRHMRLERLVERGVATSDAERRMKTQADRAARKAVAHVWVDNSGTTQELQDLASLIDRTWLRPRAA